MPIVLVMLLSSFLGSFGKIVHLFVFVLSSGQFRWKSSKHKTWHFFFENVRFRFQEKYLFLPEKSSHVLFSCTGKRTRLPSPWFRSVSGLLQDLPKLRRTQLACPSCPRPPCRRRRQPNACGARGCSRRGCSGWLRALKRNSVSFGDYKNRIFSALPTADYKNLDPSFKASQFCI